MKPDRPLRTPAFLAAVMALSCFGMGFPGIGGGGSASLTDEPREKTRFDEERIRAAKERRLRRMRR